MTREAQIFQANEKYVWANKLKNPHSLSLLAYSLDNRKYTANAAAKRAQDLYAAKKINKR